jgi:hypothetical protein
MVIDQYFIDVQAFERLLDGARAVELIEIEDKEGVGRFKDFITPIGFFIVDVDRVSTGHPSKKAGKIVWDHHFDMMSEFLEKL